MTDCLLCVNVVCCVHCSAMFAHREQLREHLQLHRLAESRAHPSIGTARDAGQTPPIPEQNGPISCIALAHSANQAAAVSPDGNTVSCAEVTDILYPGVHVLNQTVSVSLSSRADCTNPATSPHSPTNSSDVTAQSSTHSILMDGCHDNKHLTLLRDISLTGSDEVEEEEYATTCLLTDECLLHSASNSALATPSQSPCPVDFSSTSARAVVSPPPERVTDATVCTISGKSVATGVDGISAKCTSDVARVDSLSMTSQISDCFDDFRSTAPSVTSHNASPPRCLYSSLFHRPCDPTASPHTVAPSSTATAQRQKSQAPCGTHNCVSHASSAHAPLFTCRVCGAQFAGRRQLHFHAEVHAGAMHACPRCPLRFVHRAWLTRHLRQQHDCQYRALAVAGSGCPPDSGAATHCDTSPSARQPSERLQAPAAESHVSGGARDNRACANREVVCEYCGRVYLRTSLSRHIRMVHQRLAPFACQLCDRRFTARCNLRQHEQTHLRAHRCHVCGRRFSLERELHAHVVSRHELRQFVCSECGRKFAMRRSLSVHMRADHVASANQSATGGVVGDVIGRHVCDICGRGFTRRSYLTVHRRTHTGERPFRCDICGKSFANKSNYNCHVRIHLRADPSGGTGFEQQHEVGIRHVTED